MAEAKWTKCERPECGYEAKPGDLLSELGCCDICGMVQPDVQLDDGDRGAELLVSIEMGELAESVAAEIAARFDREHEGPPPADSLPSDEEIDRIGAHAITDRSYEDRQRAALCIARQAKLAGEYAKRLGVCEDHLADVRAERDEARVKLERLLPLARMVGVFLEAATSGDRARELRALTALSERFHFLGMEL